MRTRSLPLIGFLSALVLASACAPAPSTAPAASKTESPSQAAAPASGKVVTIKYSSGQAASSPKVIAARRFGQQVEERTKGAIKFEYFDTAQLYQDKDEPQAVRQGSVQMVTAALVFMDSIVPNTQVYGLPFMFGVAPEKAKELAKSDVARTIEKQIADKLGVKVLGTWYTGTTMYVTSRPVKTPDDFKSMRIRVAGSKLWEEYTTALGASPVAIAAGEQFTAAQQGLIDGIDSNASALAGLKLWQVMKYGIRTNHSTIVHTLMINGDTWKSLSPEVQKTVEETAAEVTDWEWDNGIKLLEENYQLLAQNGMNIYSPAPAELARFRDKILPLQETFLAANPDIDKQLVKKAEDFVK